MKNSKGAKSKFLRISPISADELRDRIAKENDPHMADALREMLTGCELHPEAHDLHTLWRISLRDGTELGSLAFRGAPVDGAVEIGYGIDEAYRGMGHCKAALRQAVDWAFSQPGVYFITAETTEDNAASIAALTALGFAKTERRGAEGPIFELEKPQSALTSVYMCIGMCLGVAVGTSTDNLAIGICIGVCIGLALGASLDRKDKTERAALCEKRGVSTKADAGEENDG